jgi:hypothetical protein
LCGHVEVCRHRSRLVPLLDYLLDRYALAGGRFQPL